MEARLRELKIKDVEEAFNEAKQKGRSLLAFTDHDFRNMVEEIEKVAKMVKNILNKYPEVKYKHINAIDGMREVLNLKSNKVPEFDINLKEFNNKSKLEVIANNDIFGPQPFLALKTHDNKYIWDNFDFQENNRWTYTFDFNTINLKALSNIGIAANTYTGVTEIQVIDVSNKNIEKKVLNKF